VFEWWVGFAVGAVAASMLALVTLRYYRRVDPGTALVVRNGSGGRVLLRGGLVSPSADVHRLSLEPLSLEFSMLGERAVETRDKARVEVSARLTARVATEEGHLLEAMQRVGPQPFGDPEALRALFAPVVERALGSVAGQLTGEELFSKPREYRDRVMELVSLELRSHRLDDLSISTLQKLVA